jgi:hypothetical protein
VRSRNIPPTRKNRRGGGTKVPDVGGVYDGTVGWEDGLDHFDLERSGVPLVKVTLFRGHNPVTEGENTTPARAKGRKIMARFDPKSGGIPDDGEHVIVAVPAGRSKISGASFIIGRANSDQKWIPNRKPGEEVISGPNDSFIRFKLDGSIVFFCKSGDADSGKPVQIDLSPDGFQVDHPYGRARSNKYGFELSHPASATSITGGSVGGLPAPLGAFSGFVSIEAPLVRINSPALVLGASVGQDNLLKALPVLATFDALQAAIININADLVAMCAAYTPIASPYVPTVTLAPTGLPGVAAAVTACHTAGPAQSCTGS